MELDKEFYREEERCGFTVSAEMKKVWAVELDLVEKFQQVCDAHGLRYFACGGTLLGAIRHKGFIPWDDDIDLMMPREDYEKLGEIAAAEFTPPYFYQTTYTDKKYARGHAQLRNSNTTGILKNEFRRCSFNQGIFVDIFPYDRIPDDEKAFAAMKRKLFVYDKLLNVGIRYAGNPVKSPLRNVAHAIGSLIPYRPVFRQLEKACRRYNGAPDAARVGLISFRPKDDKLVFYGEDFDEAVRVPFENLSLPVPANYDRVLRTQYGDYMVMKKVNSFHSGVIFDTERSYEDYLG